MTQRQDIIIRNFFRLIRSGAFNEYEPIERMSDYKWRKLIALTVRHNVIAIAVNGVRNSQYDNAGNIPKHIAEEFSEICQKCNATSKVSIPQSSLCNRWLNRKLKQIRRDENRTADASQETLELLNIIVFNTDRLLTKGISFGNIIVLGKYLRSRGSRVDFVKLERWLQQLKLQNIAQFEGNILISTLHFDQDEIPFVHKTDAEAYRRAMLSITTTRKNDNDEWIFKQGESGFMHNNTAALRHNLWHKLKYISYAPAETASNFLHNIASSLSQIEE